jgi:long-chain acyl-CoA synthetase
VSAGATTLVTIARSHARHRPGALALVDGAVRLTWADLDERVGRLTVALAGCGLGAGDRLLWLGQNSFRILELLLACGRLGAMCCPANWRQTPAELDRLVADLAPSIVVWQQEEVGDSVRGVDRGGARWICHDAGGDGAPGSEYEALLAAAGGGARDADAPTDPEAAVLLVYTAAFGGQPSAAMLSHRALVAQALVMGDLMAYDASTAFLNSGPMFHLGTLMSTFAAFVAGGTNAFLRRVDAHELCALIDRDRLTHAFILGPTVDQVVEANADGRYDLSSLRIMGGPAPYRAMTTPDPSRWAAHPGGYGQTETTGMVTFNALGVGGIGTHGRPSPVVDVRIVDPDDRDVAPGETGEIVVRGATVMNGYWNRPETNAARQRGGWHHTNDLGRREVDGTISFVGPKTRMIKSAAENIYPAEVEQCLREHPAIVEAAVIGVPDPTWVQSVKAIVVVRPDAGGVDAEDVIEHCRARIASYKKPRAVEFVDALPRQGLAVDYDALDARFGGGGYPGGTTPSA